LRVQRIDHNIQDFAGIGLKIECLFSHFFLSPSLFQTVDLG
jgi:hypothetical protein